MNDSIDIERLAYLLWLYDLDSPYGPGESPPAWPLAKFREWAARPHQGDCMGLSSPCLRCLIDYWKAAATWVAQELAAAAMLENSIDT